MMPISSAKENMLKKIRQALVQPVPVPFPHTEGSDPSFSTPNEDLELLFAENFSQLTGRFSFCANLQELVTQLQTLVNARQWPALYCREDAWSEILQQHGFTHLQQNNLANCPAGITGCEFLVARTGSIVLSSAQQSGRTVSVYTPVHICVAYTHQLVFDVKDGLQLLNNKYNGNWPSLVSFATGPSRTADIEKTLVVGVHGPKEVFCFLVDAG
ncbi:LutC/YkgG family protein [Hydrotalea lipotrueae]|uniref:LutC/YkgG family protein n=1 Tax=Hydrotalea lipotrueae TaxID=2803817 RepID=UPI001E3D806C|nr:LUD domain-containing protein [Hydrotalea lipotrueae]